MNQLPAIPSTSSQCTFNKTNFKHYEETDSFHFYYSVYDPARVEDNFLLYSS